MWKRLAHPAHGCFLTSALLASLALLPSSAWAARDEQKADRGKDKQQTQTQQRAQSRQTQAQPAAPSRASRSGRQPSGSVLTAPAAADRSARIDRGNAGAPALSRSREIPAPSQTTTPRADPYQVYRAPKGANRGPDRSLRAGPVGPSLSTGDESQPAGGLRTSPRVQQPNRGRSSEVTLPERGGSLEPQPSVGRLPQERGNTREQMPTLVRKPQSGQSPAVNRGTAVTPSRPGTGAHRLVVPKASFRGPGSESKVRVVAPDEGKLTPARLRDWVRQQNRQLGRSDNARPAVDVVGNPIPTDAILLSRNTTTSITMNYTKIVNNFGSPGFSYVVAPGAVWGGGYFPRTHHRHTVVVLNLFYPFYYTDPYFAGFYYPGYYPSVYAYFGWSPGWIYPQCILRRKPIAESDPKCARNPIESAR